MPIVRNQDGELKLMQIKNGYAYEYFSEDLPIDDFEAS